MGDFIESESFVLASEVRKDVAGRLKEGKLIKGLELRLKGEAMSNTREFSKRLLGLKRQGIRISHEFSIRLDFPKTISRDRVLDLVENMPRVRNGFLKVCVQLAEDTPASTEVK